ncbi:uncharacterized protein LOC129226443 [Uloborus diversus]|nr:uncharacterized protein LOC129226443 [Uloborus diversus]
MKTLKDTALLIGKLSEDLTLKVDSISPNDAEFHRQLIVQLMTTFHNIYDIFCTISVKERMNIIAENRTLLLKQNPTEPTAVAVPSVLPVVPSNLPNKKKKLSAATIKSLERKKSKSSIDSRTYTVSDFQRCKMRPHSNPTIKSHSVSPSRICKRSVAVSPKRKSASPRKSSHRLTMNLK